MGLPRLCTSYIRGVIPGCFNNRLKTNNILLDEHHFPKLSDYGMSILGEETERFDAKRHDSKSCQRASFEDDVYKFGFILLKSLVGPIASGQGETFFLNEKYAAQVQATADADQKSESKSESQDYRREKTWDPTGSYLSPTKQIFKPRNHHQDP